MTWDPRRATDYDRIGWVHNPELLRPLVAEVLGGLRRKPLVAEIGCGTGALTAYLARGLVAVGGGTLIATDPCREMRIQAADRLGLPTDHLTPWVGDLSVMVSDASALPPQADALVARMVLHHCADPASSVAEWATRVAPDGRLVIAEGIPPVTDSEHPAARLFAAARRLKEPGAHILYDDDLRHYLARTGLTTEVRCQWSTGNSLRNWLDGCGLDPSLRAEVATLHERTFRESAEAREAYQATETDDGDWIMRWRHAVAVGRR